jgi:hypothetical protein
MTPDDTARGATTRRHLRLGWAALCAFLALGIGLEALHAFKVDAYVDVRNATRRELWTLAHAHGVLLGLVNVAFAVTLQAFPHAVRRRLPIISRCLAAATVLLPLGFFLGGVTFYGGDPGVGASLIPLGAVSLLVAVWLTARDL